ncbi:MAG TPA: tripartite tricarboxylate transporter TctB family protein [Microvirga sp.]|jgi:putative tricarboxylic transport membrane protein|nr:tripartite tricarboxylate transporter TctB family protein [Microvirga sp.]
MTHPPLPRPAPARSWATADHIGGLIWLVFGAAVFYGSWTMDRLESQNIDPVTAPGLVPGLVGLGIMAFALVLLFRRGTPPVIGGHHGGTPAVGGREGHLIETSGEDVHDQPANWGRMALSWALCVGFAGLLLGRGLPFWLLAGAFVFLHILFLDDPDRIAERPLARRVLIAAIIAAGTAAAVTFVFQQIFLVRLP